MCLKHLQNTWRLLKKFIANICNIQIKHLQRICETYATSRYNTYNECLKKKMKHLEQTLETYVYSHRNMCNIMIYFCNIKMKHLQHALRNVTLLLGRGIRAAWAHQQRRAP
jgi:hypothetical protein